MGKIKGFLTEFKDFAMRGNVVDMAVGVIIGAAFGNVVTAVIDLVIQPILDAMPKLEGGGTGFAGAAVSLLGVLVNFILTWPPRTRKKSPPNPPPRSARSAAARLPSKRPVARIAPASSSTILPRKSKRKTKEEQRSCCSSFIVPCESGRRRGRDSCCWRYRCPRGEAPAHIRGMRSGRHRGHCPIRRRRRP